jgi:phosphatidylserine decarboxylase
MCEQAQQDLKIEDYDYKPDEPYWGFKSWNDFFTRRLAKGARQISNLKDSKMITSACDSTVYKISHDVQAESKFWIKSQPYSLIDMLDDNYVDEFVGGSVYQAFLSPYNYHRWHSPVTGTVKKAYVIEGLYFSQATSEGQDPTDQDHSEGYITNVQTRAIFFIEADDPAIGLVCVMPVGMVEISSCIMRKKILEQKDCHLKKGEELGHFQFGGSTHCVVFRPGVIKQFFAQENDYVQMGQDIAVAY